MRARLQRQWEKLRYSFWFVPAVMSVGAVLLHMGAFRADRTVSDEWISDLGWIYISSGDGAREVLSTIAGSMVTVAGVVFSITIVALSLASQQLGPRLLRTFMRDPGNQVVLGTFISTFLYCLLVLRTVYKEEDETFVPQLSVAFGVILAMTSLGVLIYFIHHVAISIQAPNVIALVGHDLLETIEESYPKHLGQRPPEGWAESEHETLPERFEEEARPLEADTTGYIQAVDAETLLKTAQEHDLVLRVVHRPGRFVVKGQPLVLAWPPDRATEKVANNVQFAFIVGRHRTSTQDVEFALDQLVEVALRALSSGINDPFTAITCIDWLSAGLYKLVQRESPARERLDSEGRLRIVTDVSTFEGLADAAFDQLRQAARDNVAVTCRLLEAIERVAEVCEDPGRRAVLLHHASLIHEGSQTFPQPKDRKDAADRYKRVTETLENGRGIGSEGAGERPVGRPAHG